MVISLIKQRIVYWLLLGGIILSAGIAAMIQPKTSRVILFFQKKSDGSIRTEERYIPRTTTQDPALFFVNELLLGPMNHAFFRLTDPDIQPNSCFIRGDCLYLDLPAAILAPKTETVALSILYDLLKRNVFTNYGHIRIIALSIDGVPAYEKERRLSR